MMKVETITAAAYLPISLALAKQHLNMEASDDSEDDLLTAYIQGVTDYAEGAIKGRLMKQKLRAYFSEWSLNLVLYDMAPILSVDAVKYVDANGDTQTLAASEYKVNLKAVVPYVVLTGTLPDLEDDHPHPVMVETTCGFSASSAEADQQAAIPPVVRSGLLLKLAKCYEFKMDYLKRPGMDQGDHLFHMAKFN